MSEPLELHPAYRLIPFDSLASTNDEAKRLAEAGAEEGTLVWARRQTKGRGRHGRVWESPKGNLYLSLVLRPEGPVQTAVELSFVAALAVGETVTALMPPMAMVTYKWPNDVLLNRRKVAGILLESSSAAGGALDWLVVGVGINIAEFPYDTRTAATSLRFEGTAEITVEAALEGFTRYFLSWSARWREEGFAPVRKTWWERAEGRDQLIAVSRGADRIEGKLIDMDESGAIVVEGRHGERHLVAAGDVMLGDAE